MQPQAPLNTRPVRLDGADAEYQPLGDLAIRMAQRDQADDVTLAHGQVVVIAAPLEVLGGHADCPHEAGTGLSGRW